MNGTTDCKEYFGEIGTSSYNPDSVYLNQNQRAVFVDSNCLIGRTITFDWYVGESKVWYEFYSKKIQLHSGTGTAPYYLGLPPKLVKEDIIGAVESRVTTNFAVPNNPNMIFTFCTGNKGNIIIYSIKII